jgi:hypothetical protein
VHCTDKTEQGSGGIHDKPANSTFSRLFSAKRTGCRVPSIPKLLCIHCFRLIHLHPNITVMGKAVVGSELKDATTAHRLGGLAVAGAISLVYWSPIACRLHGLGAHLIFPQSTALHQVGVWTRDRQPRKTWLHERFSTLGMQRIFPSWPDPATVCGELTTCAYTAVHLCGQAQASCSIDAYVHGPRVQESTKQNCVLIALISTDKLVCVVISPFLALRTVMFFKGAQIEASYFSIQRGVYQPFWR